MKLTFVVKTFLLFLLVVSLASACKVRKKDCRGKRKTVKTEMGGWM